MSFFLLLMISFSFRAEAGSTILHPAVQALDEAGLPVKSGRKMSEERSCGKCHDIGFIRSHGAHFKGSTKVACLQCHAKPDSASEVLMVNTLGAPQNANCGACHGISGTAGTLEIPANYGEVDFTEPSGLQHYGLTLKTGEIISSQLPSVSALNLKNKAQLDSPWDVHAARGLSCINCHYTFNGPKLAVSRRKDLGHLRFDPRMVSLAEYIRRPDHSFAPPACESCHNAQIIHEMIPYKERHLAVLACQSCHVPELHGPALQSIDQTVAVPNGKALLRFRGVQTDLRASAMNTRYLEGYRPFLLAEIKPGVGPRLAPYNLITRWFWSSESKEVSPEIIRAAFSVSEAGLFAPEVLRLLDQNGDGTLDSRELVLDTREKVEFIQARLKTLGVKEPLIRGEVSAHPVQHGIQRGKTVLRNCNSCHEQGSRLEQSIVLSEQQPFGAWITKAAGQKGPDFEVQQLRVAPLFSGLYIFGTSRSPWVNRAGLSFFLLTLLGVIIHAGARFIASRSAKACELPTTPVYMYSVYERLWHWLTALGILMLIVTGFDIHYGGKFLGFFSSVLAHNALAWVFLANAFLALFYYLASAKIRQFVPERKGLLSNTVAQIKYYTSGIMKGAPHPKKKTAEEKLNPLQQLTYLLLLNLLLPVQVITGILIWGAGKWPDITATTGGLPVLAPIHLLGSWLFVSFLILHVYLTTTGRTPLANIKAMLTGVEHLEGDSK